MNAALALRTGLAVFLLRFIQASQFKRSFLPNAPKWDREDPSRREATGVRPVMRRRRRGCVSSESLKVRAMFEEIGTAS